MITSCSFNGITFKAQKTVPPMTYHMESQAPIIAFIHPFFSGSMTMVVLFRWSTKLILFPIHFTLQKYNKKAPFYNGAFKKVNFLEIPYVMFPFTYFFFDSFCFIKCINSVLIILNLTIKLIRYFIDR